MATTEVNGKICLNPAYDVSEKDIVKYDGRRIDIINETIVVMLNKPKKVITTVKDTHNRRIVMDYIPKNYFNTHWKVRSKHYRTIIIYE